MVICEVYPTYTINKTNYKYKTFKIQLDQNITAEYLYVAISNAIIENDVYGKLFYRCIVTKLEIIKDNDQIYMIPRTSSYSLNQIIKNTNEIIKLNAICDIRRFLSENKEENVYLNISILNKKKTTIKMNKNQRCSELYEIVQNHYYKHKEKICKNIYIYIDNNKISLHLKAHIYEYNLPYYVCGIAEFCNLHEKIDGKMKKYIDGNEEQYYNSNNISNNNWLEHVHYLYLRNKEERRFKIERALLLDKMEDKLIRYLFLIPMDNLRFEEITFLLKQFIKITMPEWNGRFDISIKMPIWWPKSISYLIYKTYREIKVTDKKLILISLLQYYNIRIENEIYMTSEDIKKIEDIIKDNERNNIKKLNYRKLKKQIKNEISIEFEYIDGLYDEDNNLNKKGLAKGQELWLNLIKYIK